MASLAEADIGLVQNHLRPTTLRLRQCVEAADRPLHTIHFPYIGIISVLAETNDGQHGAEIGLIGCEGMTGNMCDPLLTKTVKEAQRRGIPVEERWWCGEKEGLRAEGRER